jgi:uncharacterized membrane protein YfhO
MVKKVKPKQIQQKEFFTLKDWHAVVCIIGSVIIFFRDILLQNAYMWEDFLYQFYPIRNFAAASMAHGELPLWNPYTFNGMPFQADIQSALFYIPNLILTLFVSGGHLHFYWVELFVILHYIIAGIGMYYLVKSYDLNKLAALFSAIVFMLSGFMVTHTIHPWIIYHAAWLPLILLLFKKALLEKSLFYTIICGLVLGHSVLTGSPQVSLYIFLFLLFYFLSEFISSIKVSLKSALSTVPPAAGVIIIAIAITAIQLLPTIELAPLSNRAEISYEKSLEGSLNPEQLITIFAPKFFGEQSALTNTYWGPGGYGQYWETSIYLGIAVLILTIIALLTLYRNRFVVFFCIILLFSILYALGDGFFLHKSFFFYIPGFNLFRNPARMSLLFTFAASILSGFGLNELIKMQSANISKVNKVIIINLVTGAVIWLLVQLGLFQNASNPEYLAQIREMATRETSIFIFILVCIGVLLLGFSKAKISPVLLPILFILIQLIDINIFGSTQNNGKTSPTEYYKNTEQLVNYLKEDGKDEYFRINSRQGGNMILDRNQGMVDNIYMMEGYTPLSLKRIYPPASSWDKICDLLNAKYRISIDPANGNRSMTKSSTYLPRAYFVDNYKILSDEEKINQFMMNQEFNPKQTALLEEDPKFLSGARNDSSSGKADISSYKLNSISLDVSTPQNGILLLSEIYYPGWNAYIDGVKQKILRANWNLRAIPVTKGAHAVDVRFEPESFRRGAFITMTSILLSVIGIVYSLYKKEKRTTQ